MPERPPRAGALLFVDEAMQKSLNCLAFHLLTSYFA
jgi:hypothetical protein